MKWIFEDKVLDIDQAFLEIIIEGSPVSLLLRLRTELLYLARFLCQVTETILLFRSSSMLIIIIGFDSSLIVIEVDTLSASVCPRRPLNIVGLLDREL